MVIAHNIYAMNAQRQFKINTKSKAKNNEKLSSGYKINRSADDAAGLSISEKMRNQIRGLNQGLKNVEDGIGYTKTAEGALNEIHSMLARMEELAVQSANDVNTEEDRKSINDEIQQLKEEMGTIFDRTAFNGKKIWEPDIKKTMSVSETEDVTQIIDGVVLEYKRVRSIIDNNNENAIPKDEKFNLNADSNGITIKWTGMDGESYESNLISWKENFSGDYQIKLSDYMDYERFPHAKGIQFNISLKIDSRASKDEAIDFINSVNCNTAHCHFENHFYGYGYDSEGNVINNLMFINERSIPIDYLYGELNFEIDDDACYKVNAITVDPIKNGNDTQSWEFSFNLPVIGDFSSRPAGVEIYANADSSYIKEINQGKDSPDVIKELLEWGNNNIPYEDLNLQLHFDILNYGGFTAWIQSVKNGDTYDDVIEPLKNTETIKLHADKNTSYIEVYPSEIPLKIEVDYSDDINSILPVKEFYIQHGANAGEDMLISYDCLSNDYLGLTNTNVLTREDSSQAINDIQEAVKKVSAQRSQFGAYQNRLEYVAANNANYSENLQNAESNLRDTDMAKEILEYSKNSILEQAAQSMVSQANQQNQGILQLLQ